MKILQITAAAPGWYAQFELPMPNKDTTIIHQPIPLWAIVEHDDGTQTVQALTPILQSLDLYPCMWPGQHSGRFINYVYRKPE